MNIPVQKLLAKIDEELKQAKTSPKEESLREKVYSIKILCELILDQNQAKSEFQSNKAETFQYQPASNQPVFQQPIIDQQTVIQPRKIDLGEEANGDSLFDF